ALTTAVNTAATAVENRIDQSTKVPENLVLTQTVISFGTHLVELSAHTCCYCCFIEIVLTINPWQIVLSLQGCYEYFLLHCSHSKVPMS
ncbi:MAG: hypothetical protein ACREA8_05835, partial [Nitrosotalea sp.]